MGFSRQEYWSGLPFPSSGDLPDPGSGGLGGSYGIASAKGPKGACEKEGRSEGIIRVVVVARAFGRRIQYNQFRGGRMTVRTVYNRRVRSLTGQGVNMESVKPK